MSLPKNAASRFQTGSYSYVNMSEPQNIAFSFQAVYCTYRQECTYQGS